MCCRLLCWPQGYGFVQFATAAEAETAIRSRNGFMHLGNALYVGPFKKNTKRHNAAGWTNCYVKHIPLDWDVARLRTLFESVGPVRSLTIVQGKNGRSKGFGYVSFQEHVHAVQAVERLHNMDMREEGKRTSDGVGGVGTSPDASESKTPPATVSDATASSSTPKTKRSSRHSTWDVRAGLASLHPPRPRVTLLSLRAT